MGLSQYGGWSLASMVVRMFRHGYRFILAARRVLCAANHIV